MSAAEWVSVDDLEPWDRNPRHNDAAAAALMAAIREFGFTAPIVAQAGTSRILAGHTRQKAVRLLLAEDPGWTAPGAPGPGMVPVRFMDVSDEDAVRITLSDNRLGDLAVWDEASLATLLQELDTSALDNLGFDDQELAVLLGEWEDPFADVAGGDAPGEAPLVDDGTAKIMIELPITAAQDASAAIRVLLEQQGLPQSKYKLSVT